MARDGRKLTTGLLPIMQQFCIANAGTKNELRFSSASYRNIVDENGKEVDTVWIVSNYDKKSKCWRYGLLRRANRSRGELTVPVVYKNLSQIASYTYKWDKLFLAENDNGEVGVIDIDNKVIYPFVHKGVILPLDTEIVDETGLIIFCRWKKKRKFGLSKWPSAEVVYPAEWDNIKPFANWHGAKPARYWQLEKKDERIDEIRKNILKSDNKLMFEEPSRYFYFDYRPGRLINIGATAKGDNLDWGDYSRKFLSGVDFDVFDQNGKVLYSEEACDFEFLYGYSNVLIVIGPGGHSHFDYSGYALVFWADEKGETVMKKITLPDAYDRKKAFKEALKKAGKEIRSHVEKY